MAKKRASKNHPVKVEERVDAGPKVWERSWFPAAVFALLSLVYFSEFLFSDKVIYGGDIGKDFHQGAELTIGEKIKTLAQPMWNPQMGGFPQSEEIRPQYFPTYAIYFFTTFQRHLGWRYILTMFFAGWGMYSYLREIQAGRWAAVWSGVAYMSAPTFLAFPFAGHYAKMGVIALFPWMCFFLERGMKGGRLIHFAGLAGMIALGIYSHPPLMYYALCGIGLYFLFRMVLIYREKRDRWVALGRAGFFTLAVGLGLGLGAEGVLPLFMYTRTESKRASGGEEGGKSPEEQLAFARSWSLHPEEVGSLIVPEFGGFYDPVQGRNYYWGRNAGKYNSEYFGILVLLLALLVVPEVRRRPFVLFMGGLFALVLAFTLGGHTPIHWLVFHLLPGAKVQRTIGMSAFLFAFPACAMAGLGLHRVLQVEAEERPLLGKRLLIAGGVLTGLALLVALAPRAMADIWISVFYSGISETRRQILSGGYDWLARGGLYVVLVAGCGTILLYLRIQQKIGIALVVVGLCVLTLFDSWRIDRIFLKYEDPARYVDIRRENPRTMQFLQRDDALFRIFPLPDHGILREQGYNLHGIPVVTGFHDLTIGRYDRMLREFLVVENLLKRKYYGRQEIPYSDEALLEAVQPLLNLLNARYIAAAGGIELHSERFPLAFTGERFRLYENLAVLPWFYLVPSCQVVEGEKQIIELLKSGQVDLRETVLLERQPPAGFGAAPKGAFAEDRVERLDYDLPGGQIRLRTRGSGPRMLVLSENYHSNWHAFVDGLEVEIYRANYVWKAVHVPAGEHVVEFRYRSRTLTVSRGLGLLSLLIVLGMGGWEYRQGRRKTAEETEPA